MKFSVILATLVAVASAAPAQDSAGKLSKRAVFTAKTFDEISISGGTAGTAKEDALQKLSGLPTDLSKVDQADLTFLNSVNKICNQAENGAFNVKIAATTPGEDALTLQRGKIQNKVLKLTATVMSLQAQQAQGKNVTAKLEEETKKLNKNIADDQANKGKPATALKFNASTDNPTASNVAKDDALAKKATDVVEASIQAVGGNNVTAKTGKKPAKPADKGKKPAKPANKEVVAKAAAAAAEDEDEE